MNAPKVSDALRHMLLQGPAHKHLGICHCLYYATRAVVSDYYEEWRGRMSESIRQNSMAQLQHDLDYAWEYYKRAAIASWPEHVHDTYPVPHPKPKPEEHSSRAAARAYDYTYSDNKWGPGAYGNARRRLLRHLIVWFKERGM